MTAKTKRILAILVVLFILLGILMAAEWIKLGYGGSEEVQVREIGVGTK
jgi:hypothetical protein